MKTGHPIVDAIGTMAFEGNIIPHSWYQCAELRYDNGKTNLNAIILLSDILYWYRPAITRDEATGHVVSSRKKFRDDMLHKDYALWSQMFGLTKRQIQDTIKFLKDRDLIRQELRDVITPTGARIYNAVFLEPVPASIYRITFEIDLKPASFTSVTPITLERDTSPVETGHLSPSIVTPPPIERDSCTETTMEIKEMRTSSKISKLRFAPEVYSKALEKQSPSYRSTILKDSRGPEKYLETYHAAELLAVADELGNGP